MRFWPLESTYSTQCLQIAWEHHHTSGDIWEHLSNVNSDANPKKKQQQKKRTVMSPGQMGVT